MRPLVKAFGFAILFGGSVFGAYTAAKAENECVRVYERKVVEPVIELPEQLEARDAMDVGAGQGIEP